VIVSRNALLLSVGLALLIFASGLLLGLKHFSKGVPILSTSSLQKEMDEYCLAQLNDRYLSKLSPDAKSTLKADSFFSGKLHTCVAINVTLDPKDAGAMNYAVSDLTQGFVAPPKWHLSDHSLSVFNMNHGNFRHLHAEGAWLPVNSAPDQQPIADANKVKITCDYSDLKPIGDDENVCIETEGYTRFGSIDTDTQTFHIALWGPDEVIATDVEHGLSGSTATTLLIHPKVNEIEVVDRTNMDEKQPELLKGESGKSYGDHYELNGGMYLLDTQGMFFQCNEDGVVIDMRTDVVAKHHGDVVNLPDAEWNVGKKGNHKFTDRECEAAMHKKLEELR
jgi:hypothetical protein